MRKIFLGMALLGLCYVMVRAQEKSSFSQVTKSFISVDSPAVALEHVRVIDGTGAAAAADQTIVIENGRIREIGKSGSVSVPSGARILDLTGRSVIPGLVGMHDHLFYPAASGQTPVPGAPALYGEMGFSFPRLYLAGGVTSLRTTGSLETYTDLALKKLIDMGKIPGPKMHITGPYLEGAGSFTPQLHELSGPEDAVKLVNYWIDEGVTSFKAYMHITRAELSAAIKAAHARGIKVTGHLCSVGFTEAADLGMDDLEHGIVVDQEFNPSKQPDVCPPSANDHPSVEKVDVESEPVQSMIKKLVQHHVALTSTLVIFETFAPEQPPVQDRILQALSLPSRTDYLSVRSKVVGGKGSGGELLKKEMQFEHDFVKAGGVLLSGEDPTGYGGVLAGFGDQRQTELLVEAGFTPLEAIHIATQNGAEFLGEGARIGTLKAGKQADLVVINGDPSEKIADIENVEFVFKDGVGYDSAKLIQSVQGAVGLH
ncbi:MAG TPA: amidohydrolase family protein [Candidatus Acidoferrum sp.]|nr:amidohydrolase family protein [Candidatus Acidoferrum sp.]